MTGKTHFAVGEAAALLLTHPSTPRELALCIGTAAVGSLICDVDSTTSRSHKELAALLSVSAFAVVVISALELHFDLGILRLLQHQTNAPRILLGLTAFLLICGYGMKLPHRSFMHSLPCLALLSGLCWEIFPTLFPAFAVGMASHLILDITNRRGLQLFFPLKKRYCLRLCSSSGKINNTVCHIGSAAVLLGLALSLFLIFY